MSDTKKPASPTLDQRRANHAWLASTTAKNLVIFECGDKVKAVQGNDLAKYSLEQEPNEKAALFRIIGEINRAGTTILLVEQNTRQALALAGRGYVLENGRVVLTGAGRDLLDDEHVQRAYLGM